MDRRTFKLIERACLTILMMLGPVVCKYDNSPKLDISCDATGLQLKISFSKPFNGIVFANGFKFDPLCRTFSDAPSMNEFLTLPLMACGTNVEQAALPQVTNTIVIQQHSLLETKYDIVETITCQLPESIGDLFWISRNSLKQAFGYDAPQQKPRLELDLKQGKQISKYRGSDKDAVFIVLQLRNKGMYNDIYVKNCIAYDSEILDENTSVYQVTDPGKCSNEDSKPLSTFAVDASSKGLMAYSELLADGRKLKGNVHFTCEAVLCKDVCTCSDVSQLQTFYTTKMVHLGIKKRAIATTSDNLKQQDTNRYLRSTIKALATKLAKYRMQMENKNATLDKRWRWVEESTFPSTTEVIAPTDTTVSESISTLIYNVEPHRVDIYNSSYELDDSEFHEILSTDSLLSLTDMTTEVLTKEAKVNTPLQMSTTEDSTDLVSFISETAINTDLDNVTISSTMVYNFSEDNGNCIPRLRFTAIIVVLSFTILCLLLVCCGMAFYIRKEKKRHLIDNFLLYNFY